MKRDERLKRLADIRKESKRLDEAGNDEEILAHARQAVAEFPSEEDLQLDLACALERTLLNQADRGEELDQTMLAEEEKILLTLLETTKNNAIRHQVLENLIAHYGILLKDNARALEYANHLTPMKYCREEVLTNYTTGEEHPLFMQDHIDKLTDSLGLAMKALVLDDALPNDSSTWERKIELPRKIPLLYRLIYGEDLKFYHCRHSDTAWLVSTYQIALGQEEEALDSLEEACRHALAYDKAYAEQRFEHYASPFVDRLIYPAIGEDFHELTEHNRCFYTLGYLAHRRYDGIRENERFRAVEKTLRENAK